MNAKLAKSKDDTNKNHVLNLIIGELARKVKSSKYRAFCESD